MYVAVVNEQTVLALDRGRIAAVVRAVVAAEGQRCDEVAIHFVTLETISDLHLRFFDDPSPTDCISLPIDEVDDGTYRHLGEVFVCPQVACDYVAAHGGDAYEETILYVVHGLLHLMGYDDLEESAEAAMRKAEESHLTKLKGAGLVLGPVFS